MKAYLINGTSCEIDSCVELETSFYFLPFQQNKSNHYNYDGDAIISEIDCALVDLYDSFQYMYFPNTDIYYSEIKLLPLFVSQAGFDSDSSLTKDDFSFLINNSELKTRIPDLNRHLYLYDIQNLISTIQNLVLAMNELFVSFYINLADIYVDPFDSLNSNILYTVSPETRRLSSMIEMYFVKANSILDVLSKIVYETENTQMDFLQYPKLKSKDILFGDKKRLKIMNCSGSLFENIELTQIIESIRNEIIHNGSLEQHPKVFIVKKDETIVERYMLSPDISQGRLSSCKNRKRFFGNGTKVNTFLKDVHFDFMNRLLFTIERLNKNSLSPEI